MFQTLSYPIQKLQLQELIDKQQLVNCRVNVEEELYHFTVRATKEFAVGSQVRTENTYKVQNTHEALIPKTSADWVKKLIIKFCPQLNFGWIKPEYRQITKQQKIYTTNTYYNLYPIKEQWDRPQYQVMWLESEPFTKAEWATATTKVKPIRRYSSSELADEIAEYLYMKGEFN